MGAYSTVDITRKQAIEKICELVHDAKNSELEDVLFDLTCNHCLSNYMIVEEKESDHERTDLS